jgi:rubrerythrin
MFCPKCGEELVRKNGELTCVRGTMGVTQDVEAILSERFRAHKPSPKRASIAPVIRMFPSPMKTGPRFLPSYPWFCPGCGVVLDDKMRCPECDVSIADLQGPLLERHPHLVPLGEWR